MPDQVRTLAWDLGTAYDLFVSLDILHHPEKVGLRRAWAAGVRSRLGPDQRQVLEDSLDLSLIPVHWVYALPAPKDAVSALQALAQIPAHERLEALSCCPHEAQAEWYQVLREVAARGSWHEQDRATLLHLARARGGKASGEKKVTRVLHWWAQPQTFGERYLAALRAYHEVFFAEEEKRIRPALEAALARAQELASRLPLDGLLETLSRGLRFTALPEEPQWVLAPSYWVTPRILYTRISERQMAFLFGARPSQDSLVPGDAVPDDLLQALKALSDPTRLRLLRYLAADMLTPAELARRLRLRPPTVKHHLDTLRLAGLVTIAYSGKKEMRYTARLGTVQQMLAELQHWLSAPAGPDNNTPSDAA